MQAYFESNNNYNNKPLLFGADSAVNISIESFSPQAIDVVTDNANESKLILQQNFYPHWFYTNGKEKKEVQTFGTNFMSASINKGKNKTRFIFEPTNVKIAMVVSLVIFIIYLLLLFILPTKTKHSFPSSLQQ